MVYTGLYRTVSVYTGVYRTKHDYIGRHRTIRNKELYRSIHYLTSLYRTLHKEQYRTIQNYIGLERSIQEYTWLSRIVKDYIDLYRVCFKADTKFIWKLRAISLFRILSQFRDILASQDIYHQILVLYLKFIPLDNIFQYSIFRIFFTHLS